jgi:hypothetical protein
VAGLIADHGLRTSVRNLLVEIRENPVAAGEHAANLVGAQHVTEPLSQRLVVEDAKAVVETAIQPAVYEVLGIPQFFV